MKKALLSSSLAVAAAISLTLFAGCRSPAVQTSPPAFGGSGRAGAGKQKLLFYTTSSTDSPHRAVLPLLFAVTAAEKGHDAVIFLGGDGVLLMKDTVAADVKAVGQPGASELLARATGLQIPIRV
jgi:hypothetical protein